MRPPKRVSGVLRRVDIDKHEDGTISFQLRTTFFFNQEKSGDVSPDDVVTLVHFVILTCTAVNAIYGFRDLSVLVGAEGYFGRLLSHATPFTLPPTISQNSGRMVYGITLAVDDDGELAFRFSASATKVKKQYPFAMKMLNPIVAEIFNAPSYIFLTGTAREILFDGVTVVNCTGPLSPTAEMLCDQLMGILPETVRITEPGIFKFSFYHHRNGTIKGRYRVDRGISDPRNLGKIVEYEGRKNVTAWGQEQCNMINGTDSSIFPPFITDSQIDVFFPEICRSLSLEFKNEGIYKDVAVRKYGNSPHTFEDPDVDESNKCFCTGKGRKRQCLKRGVLELTNCQGVPTILSYPHLYMASPEYQTYAKGLSPSKEKHEAFLEIEPVRDQGREKGFGDKGRRRGSDVTTYGLSPTQGITRDTNRWCLLQKSGLLLHAANRVQLNIFMVNIPELDLLKNVSEGLFPVIWMDEGIEVDDPNMATLKKAFKYVNAFNTIKWLAIVVGVGVIGVALYLMKQNKNRGSYDNRVLPTLSTKTQGEINMAFEGSGKKTANKLGVTTVQEVLRNEKGDIDASTLERNSAKSAISKNGLN
uniref:Sensory neuron membrane protein 1 n=1 Tax=Timema monikensis TaxID=170555 RepID=A0A7R9EE18_9NEOP|nr:unnamed protein product [Timema monikensis]